MCFTSVESGSSIALQTAMAALNLQKRLHRIGGEIRFRSNLASAQNVIDAARLVEKSYPEFNFLKGRQQQEGVVLHSPEIRKALQVRNNSMIYTNETEDNTTELLSQFGKIYQKLVLDSDVENIVHIGYRNIAVYEVDLKYSELVEITFEKLYPQESPIKDISCDKPLDTAFVLDAEKKGIKNHVRIGPMSKAEVLQNFSSNFEVDSSVLKGEVYLHFDIDTFVSEGHPSTALKKLEEIIAENNRIFEEYKDYLTN